MDAEVGAVDRFREALQTIAQNGVERQIVMAAQIALPAVFDMPIRVDLPGIAEKNKQIDVAAITKAGFGLYRRSSGARSEATRLDPLPRRIRTIELIRAVGFIAVSEENAAGAKARFQLGK